MNPVLVELLKQLVTIVGTFVFLTLVGKFPDFPVPQDVFVKFLVWAVLTLLGVHAIFAGVARKYFSGNKR